MKIAAIVILYYPEENLVQNIQSYIHAVQKLYIIDNSENPKKEVNNALNQFQNAIYINDGKNKGIAARLNQASNLAISEGFDWLLTMDQDSMFQDDMLTDYLHCIEQYQNKEMVSMFGVNFTEEDNKKEKCNPAKVNHLITSGSVLNLQLFNNVGGFDENLFIDEVDFEYCLRSISRDFRIIQFTNIFLSHNLGETSFHRSFKSIKITSRVLHSPERMYYITRNFSYVQSKYRTIFPGEINQRRKFLLNRLKNNILYNQRRFKVIKNIVKGFLDFRKNRMGKLK